MVVSGSPRWHIIPHWQYATYHFLGEPKTTIQIGIESTLLETNSSHLQSEPFPKGNDHLPTIHFHVLCLSQGVY